MSPAEESRPGRDEAIEAEAAAWLAQRDDGLTPEEETKFTRWRQASPRHEAAVQRLELAWRMLQTLQNFRPEAQRHPDRDLLASTYRKKVIPFSVYIAGAAALMLLAAVPLWRHSIASGHSVASTYMTADGGFQRVTLVDGSVMELNATSEARVDFVAAERRIQLLHGEASFSVAKNKMRPFVVSAGPIAVRAVGTAFDVRFAEHGGVEVLVTEGVVKLAKSIDLSSTPSSATVELATLEAGQHAMILPESKTAVRVEKMSPEKIHSVLAWQSSRMIFSDTPLVDVLHEFNRRNQVKLELGDPELGALPVGGSFQAENVEAFVRLITGNNDIVAERPSPDRIVLRKAK